MLSAVLAVSLIAGPALAQKEKPEETVPPVPQTIYIFLDEWEIIMPDRIKAGEVIFRVFNKGTINHGLVIAGNGIMGQIERDLRPGQSTRMRIFLDPGEYSVHSPNSNRRMEGMETTVLAVKP